MRRTLERSQRVDQRQKRWSWGGLSTDSDGRTGRASCSSTLLCAVMFDSFPLPESKFGQNKSALPVRKRCESLVDFSFKVSW